MERTHKIEIVKTDGQLLFEIFVDNNEDLNDTISHWSRYTNHMIFLDGSLVERGDKNER